MVISLLYHLKFLSKAVIRHACPHTLCVVHPLDYSCYSSQGSREEDQSAVVMVTIILILRELTQTTKKKHPPLSKYRSLLGSKGSKQNRQNKRIFHCWDNWALVYTTTGKNQCLPYLRFLDRLVQFSHSISAMSDSSWLIDCSPFHTVHGGLKARILKLFVISSSRGSP